MESLDRFVIQVALTANNALDWLRLEDCAVVFAEFPVPGWEPADLLEAILEIAPRTPVILRDPEGTVADAVRLMKLGAYHFMSGPLEENELLGRLEMAAEKHGLRESAAGRGTPGSEPWKRFFIGESRPVREVEHIIRLAGPKRAPF